MFSKRDAFPFLSFAVPLLLRAVPEALMGPYVVGFDTMGHYVPTTLLWLRGDVTFLSFIGTAPLFYSIVSLASLGGSLIVVLKVVPVLLQGFLGLSIYAFANKGLGWSARRSAATALLGTLYFVALRVSWDQLRNMLGLVFFFVALTLFSIGESEGYSRKRYALLSLSMVAVVFAHQLVSVIMLGVFAFTISFKLFRRQQTGAVRLVLACLPASLLFLAVFSLLPTVPEYRLIFGLSTTNEGWFSLFGVSSYPAMLLSEAGFFFYCFLPLLPFLLLGVWRLKNFQIRSWLVLSLILLFVPMVSPSNLRWVTMLTYPLAFCAIEVLSRLKSVSWKRFGLTLGRIGIVYLFLTVSILSLGFMLMTPEKPFLYFAEQVNGYVYHIPTSMLQNTVSIADCRDTANVLQWFRNNVDGSALLLTHRVFYGWAMSTVDSDKVFLYEYNDPADSAATVARQGHDQIYLIWWVNGQGWYGQSTVPSSFMEVYRSCRIAIYYYAPNSMA